MAVPTVSWSETSPAGSDSLNQGDNRIRELKTQIREVIDVDHDFPSSGQANDVGQHKKCTFQEQADLGTGAVNATILGSQTVSGKGELVYSDEDNNDIQITSGGKIKAESIAGVYPAANVAAIANIMGLIYPVGVVVTLGVSTNPGTLFGVGTWTAIAGKVIVGIDAGQTEFDTLDETGGAKTHTLTTDEIPAHTHTYLHNGNTVGGSPGGDGTQTLDSTATSSTGGGQAHNNLQPYIVKYVWQRTS
jgi:hypothetical protein